MSAFAAEQISEVYRAETELKLKPYLVTPEREERVERPIGYGVLRCPLVDLLPQGVLLQLYRMVN